MNAKKLLMPILILCAAICLMVGCTPKKERVTTEYDDMEITKIEAAHWEGMAPFPGHYLRTFDFKHGTVCDTRVTDRDVNEILGDMPVLTADDFNKPKQVATFTQKQAIALYEKIKSLGFLAWEDEYVTSDVICDGGNERVTVYFADGTKKSTEIYFKYPPKYEDIRKAFEDYTGMDLYYWW